MGNIFDSFGQNLGAMSGLLGQQTTAATTNGYLSLGCTTSGNTVTYPGSFTIDYPVEKPPAVKKGPESALAWLNRRVEEMRVKL